MRLERPVKGRSRAARWGAALLVAGLVAGAGAAHADVPEHKEPVASPVTDMAVVITPATSLSGTSLPWGWSTVVVSITNNGSAPTRGEVRGALHKFGNKRAFESQAPYAVPAGGTVQVKLPIDVMEYAEIEVRVVDVARGEIGSAGYSAVEDANVMLLDTAGSQLKGAIHETPVVTLFEKPGRSGRGSGSSPTVVVAQPRVDPATGDPVLPDRAALFNAVDVALFRSDMLARMSGPELEGVAGFVLAGGTVAVAITRPEDVRHPTIAALAGGEVVQTAVSSETLRALVLARPSSSSGRETPVGLAPGEDMSKLLGGFRGGNLRGSSYGASAPYGLGEVHLLAFDPTRKPALDDDWVKVRMIDLARRAHDRRATVVFRPGEEQENVDLQRVRKQLDPNESSRWAIGAAALLLLFYAVLAGPLNYFVAARRNKPLSALRILPLLSALTFFVIVGIGMVAKGVSGRARHLSLIEAGAGMNKGAVRRFRAFFSSRAKELTVRTTDASSVVRTVIVSEPGEAEDRLVIDREGARLENVNALPWQTLVMREDGIAPLGDGIAIVKKDPAGFSVKNRSGHSLRGALLRLPGGEIRYFGKIADGEMVESSAGREIGTLPKDRPWLTAVGTTSTAGVMLIYPLRAYALAPILQDDAPGLADAWQAIEDAGQRDAGWFVDDVPVLIAQMDGGEGRSSDGGLRLESDRLLVRVVGIGGAL